MFMRLNGMAVPKPNDYTGPYRTAQSRQQKAVKSKYQCYYYYLITFCCIAVLDDELKMCVCVCEGSLQNRIGAYHVFLRVPFVVSEVKREVSTSNNSGTLHVD